jgi:rabenosyn-5
MYGDSEIVEGFICPICRSDEKNIETLLKHFDEQHSEEKDLISTFRDVFKIAKKKILNFDDNDLSRTLENTLKTSKSLMYNPFQELEFSEEPQDIGVLTNHFDYFKAIRNPRIERYATETNKLIIRLNKLLTNRPTEPQQIKQHEQNVSLSLS